MLSSIATPSAGLFFYALVTGAVIFDSFCGRLLEIADGLFCWPCSNLCDLSRFFSKGWEIVESRLSSCNTDCYPGRHLDCWSALRDDYCIAKLSAVVPCREFCALFLLISFFKLAPLKLCVGLPSAKFIALCFYSIGSISVEMLNWLFIVTGLSSVDIFPRSNCEELCMRELKLMSCLLRSD